MSLDKCVFSHLTSVKIWYEGYSRKSFDFDSIWDNLVTDEQKPNRQATIEKRSLPLKDGELVEVDWYYSLFTEDELKTALEKHDSAFPTKCFLVFSEIESITLGASGKELVKFIKVDKQSVVDAINDAIDQLKKSN